MKSVLSGGAFLKSLFSRSLALFLLPLTFMQLPAIHAQESPLPLMPQPAHVVEGPGQFLLDGSLSVELQGYKDARVLAGKQRFLGILYRETGIPLLPETQSRTANFVIKTDGAGRS